MRLVYFILILVVSVMLPWWLVVPVWACYALTFRAYELVVLGIAIDAYFGYALPWHLLYTLAATVLCAGTELLKPRMAFYDVDPER